MKALGAGNLKHDWFATQAVSLTLICLYVTKPKSELSPTGLAAYLRHTSAPAPLSASEAALKEIKEAEAVEAKRAALDPETEARRRKAVVALGGKMGWDNGVEEALKKAAERSDDGWLVTLVSNTPQTREIR